MTTAYVDIATATIYFNDRVDDSVWVTATTDQRDRALKTATRLIDRLNFHGTKTVSTQENEFPRNGNTTVETTIQYACCEIAYSLLDGRDPEFESENINTIVSNIGSVKVGKDVENVPIHMIHNIPSAIAWSYLRPHLVNTSSINVQRIN